MFEIRKPIPYEEALDKVLKIERHKETINMNIDEAAGYTLSEDIVANTPIPLFDKSPYDGFAIRSEDTRNLDKETLKSIEFNVVDHIGAGFESRHELARNEAVRIMTGAPIPRGADCVVMFEQVKLSDDESTFTIRKSFEQGENVAKQGEECNIGDILITEGTMINAGVIAVLKTFGIQSVHVYRPLSAVVVATGSELVDDPNQSLKPGQIRNSNSPMIKHLLESIHVEVCEAHYVFDDLDTTINTLKNLQKEYDIVITTGGVSVGDFDYIQQAYEALNAEVLFNKVAMRPGSVTTVATTDEAVLFGLSGNPSACYSGFYLFVYPFVRNHLNHEHVTLPTMKCTLKEDFTKANPFTRFVRANAFVDETGQWCAKLAGFNKSNAVTSLAHTNALIVLPGGTRGFQHGDVVDMMLITDY